MYSKEFFVQRSFEVVWAVFRVAEHTVRPKIKDGLEDKATDYLLAKNSDTLDELEQIVRFCAQIKEISSVNANVILREIGNLRSAMMEVVDNQRRQLPAPKDPEKAPKVEEVFSRPPMKVSDLLEEIRRGIEKIENLDKGKEVNNESAQGGQGFDKESKQGNPLKTDKSPAREKDNSNQTLVNSEEIETKNLDKPVLTNEVNSGKSPAREDKSPAREKDRFEAAIGFKERNEIIMNLLSKRSLCHLKDLMSILPDISERTVRYDIQRLVDKGIIERVGTGGPNSFFRLKREQVENKPKAV